MDEVEEEGDEEAEDDGGRKANPLEDIFTIRREMKKMGIALYPPVFGVSSEDYSLESDGIRMGLCTIHGLRGANLDKLKSFRKDCKTKIEMFEALCAAKVSLSALSPLILSGCLGLEGESRNKLLMELEVYKELTARELPYIHKFAPQYNNDIVATIKALATEIKDEKGKTIIKDTRLDTLRRDLTPVYQKYKRNEINRELSYWTMEMATLGFAYSAKLKSIYDKDVKDLIDINEVLAKGAAPKVEVEGEQSEYDGIPVRFVCQITESETKVARASGRSYIRLVCRDEDAMVTGLVFGKSVENILRANSVKEVPEGVIAIINGSIKPGGDTVFINTLTIQDNPTVMKKSELTKKE